MASSPVDIATMPHVKDGHDLGLVIDIIQHAVVTDPDAPAVRADKFLDAARSWGTRKVADRGDNATVGR